MHSPRGAEVLTDETTGAWTSESLSQYATRPFLSAAVTVHAAIRQRNPSYSQACWTSPTLVDEVYAYLGDQLRPKLQGSCRVRYLSEKIESWYSRFVALSMHGRHSGLAIDRHLPTFQNRLISCLCRFLGLCFCTLGRALIQCWTDGKMSEASWNDRSRREYRILHY